ncbi:TPA: hypothetical protein RFU32_004015, partial [Klebsiella pneumoniae subsp. pneumoniae]|nr:hypothetical protein [Klebsiella pneumoniae subsp. pneumoniae]HDU4960884.1 hypothetical protein [Klebsiella pneumoniae subsp. pneumoniae]
MTDITELAQRMSIERIKQIALGGTPIMGEKESLAITALHFAEELKIATDAFQAAGLAQLAAEEALEKAQQRISQLESRTVKLPDALLPATHKSGELFMTPDNVEQGGYLNRDDVLRVL